MPFLTGWGKRKEIRYGTVFPGSNLSNFPLLLLISGDSDIAAELAAGGGIAVTASDGATEIPFGLYPSSDPTSGDLILRFKTGVLAGASTGDVIAYLYYDAGQTTSQDKIAVVSNAYAAFLVPGDYGSGDICEDWVSGDRVGGQHGLSSSDLIAGVYGQAWDLDGAGEPLGDYLAPDASGAPDLEDEITVEIWTQWDGTTDRRIVFALALDDSPSAGNSLDIEFREAWTEAVFSASKWGGMSLAYSTVSGVLPGNTWTRFAYATEGSWANQLVMFNGTSQTILGTDVGNTGTPTVCRIGSFNAAFPTPYHNRPVGEVRLSSVKRSVDWLAYAYANEASNSDTLTPGDEETDGGGGTTFEEDYSGSCAPSGSLVKFVSQALAGSSASSGALAKLAGKGCAGSSTGSGSCAKQAAKSLTGNSSPSGALTTEGGSETTAGAIVHVPARDRSVARVAASDRSIVRVPARDRSIFRCPASEE